MLLVVTKMSQQDVAPELSTTYTIYGYNLLRVAAIYDTTELASMLSSRKIDTNTYSYA